MTVVIQVENDPHRSPFIKLEDEQFIQLWAFLKLPAHTSGTMYGIKMRTILTEAGKHGVYSASVNDLITGLDVIRVMGLIVNAAMEREEKIAWFYEDAVTV